MVPYALTTYTNSLRLIQEQHVSLRLVVGVGVKLSGKRAEADFHHTASATIRDESSKVLASLDVQYMWICDNIALILPILRDCQEAVAFTITSAYTTSCSTT